MSEEISEYATERIRNLKANMDAYRAENAALKARAEKAESDLKSALDHINQQSFKILGLEMELKEKTYDD